MIILITGASHTGKTALENRQNLIVEGCYIPFDWSKDLAAEYLEHIRYCCLVMSERYLLIDEEYQVDIWLVASRE